MIMKMHSYMYVNGYLSFVAKDATALLKKLEHEAERVGGWEKAMMAAKSHQQELDAATQRTDSGTETPEGSPAIYEGTAKSYMDVSAASVLRQRLVSTNKIEEISSQDVSRSSSPAPEPIVVTPHTLVDHPDQELSRLAKEYSELEAELSSTGPEQVRWPANIGWKKFAVYQLIPTLVYELEYPRTEK